MLQLTSATSGIRTRSDQNALIKERVRGEFREMPGLTLTLAQAARLWSLDPVTCGEVVSELVEAGYLAMRGDGAYARASDFAGRPFRMARASIEPSDAQPRRRLADA